jgi:hypothetical protein
MQDKAHGELRLYYSGVDDRAVYISSDFAISVPEKEKNAWVI